MLDVAPGEDLVEGKKDESQKTIPQLQGTAKISPSPLGDEAEIGVFGPMHQRQHLHDVNRQAIAAHASLAQELMAAAAM